MRPIVNGLAEEYDDQVIFQELNAVEEGQELFQKYNLRGHPSYVILNSNGEVLWRLIGEVDRSALEEGIEQALP